MTAERAEVPGDLGRELVRVATAAPERRALSFPGGVWTYSRLLEAASEYREVLGLAPAPGISRVLLEVPTSPQRIAALFGAWMGGWVVLPVHDDATGPEREGHIAGFAPAGRLGDAGLVPLAESIPPGSGAEGTPPHPYASALVLSSGTTGVPRGVLLGPDQFRASADAAAARLDLTGQDEWGLALSTAHIGGLALVTRAVRLGCAIRLWPRFDAGQVAAAVVEGAISHVSLVPVMLDSVLQILQETGGRPARRFRAVLTGGAQTTAVLQAEARKASVPLALTYGMTEACSQVATATPSLGELKSGTVGSPLHGIEIRIDSGSTGSGEILVRGPTLAVGAIQAGEPWALTALTNEEGWFRTGDLGSLDSDGHLWIEGRREGRIVTGGYTVDPREVEDIVVSVDGVREVAVVGVPDPTWGEIVVAFFAGEAWATTEVLVADIDETCRQRLTRAKCPSHIVQIDALPRNRNGKVLRRHLVEAFTPTRAAKDGRTNDE